MRLTNGRRRVGSRKGRSFERYTGWAGSLGTGMTPKVLGEIVREAASRAGIEKLAPHDLRPYLCEALPFSWRRIGSNPVSARSCLDPDHRAIPRVQAEATLRSQRP